MYPGIGIYTNPFALNLSKYKNSINQVLGEYHALRQIQSV
jgi:hypothetical protein